MKGHLYQPLAKKPQSAFRQKPLNDLQNQSSRRFMPSLWDGCENFSLFAVRHSMNVKALAPATGSAASQQNLGFELRGSCRLASGSGLLSSALCVPSMGTL
jgi:hypothetical protein